jgi:F0F1-type ATP synthase gamma subunit
VLVVTSDRGLAGGYNANALKTAAQLEALLRNEGKDPGRLPRRAQGGRLLQVPRS